MNKLAVGRGLIIASAVSSILIPIVVDGIVFADAHMQNPLWLPHAKLHCAMSFHAAIALGAAAIALLASRWNRTETSDLAIAAFLGAAFWAGLLLARLWPGTSWQFAGDPAFVTMTSPEVLGVSVDPNAAIAVVVILACLVGFLVAAGSVGSRRTVSHAAV